MWKRLGLSITLIGLMVLCAAGNSFGADGKVHCILPDNDNGESVLLSESQCRTLSGVIADNAVDVAAQSAATQVASAEPQRVTVLPDLDSVGEGTPFTLCSTSGSGFSATQSCSTVTKTCSADGSGRRTCRWTLPSGATAEASSNSGSGALIAGLAGLVGGAVLGYELGGHHRYYRHSYGVVRIVPTATPYTYYPRPYGCNCGW
jgi:hypothetical protein